MAIAPPEWIDDPRPSISKYRFWPLAVLAMVGAIAVFLLILWLTSGPSEPASSARDDGAQMLAAARPLPGLPTDYTQIKRPPPPAPPPQQAEAPPPPEPAPTPAPRPQPVIVQGGTPKKSWREEAREASPTMITVSNQAQGGQQAQQSQGSPAGDGRGDIYSSARLTAPFPDQVNAGTPLRAHTEQPITTDAPGYVTALVLNDVYTADKRCVAIPHGSRLFGETIGEVKEGQVRVTTVWTALTRPQPRNDTITLTRVVGAESDGTPGIRGTVNNHWWRKFGFIVASSAIDLGTAALSGRGSNGTAIVIGGTVAENARSPLDQFVKKQLDIPPTIEVSPREISVMLSQHLPMSCFGE